jgi:hypothetical protein
MARKFEHPQPSLFNERTPLVRLCPACRVKLAGVVDALLCEIAAMLANGGESVDEQDHC